MKKIDISTPTYPNMFALVDDENFEWLNQWKWFVSHDSYNYYAVRNISIGKGRQKSLRMHNVIMRPPTNMEVDHRDDNGLNNQRLNLRICTHSQNIINAKKKKSRSRYKGASYNKATGKWMSRTQKDQKELYIGLFDTEIEAAKAYDKKAIEIHGEFARLNFPQEYYERIAE